ncbi:Bifunctional purine biosynthesis protein PurH [Buchnera aphidicola (Eriosoma grossulariae)]|uniref:bifunctional phosphoribosylaminoimidazolecarboxamide formyltransferase/IMP cyclohydrolase n=1 Tax=Buchnera aphidicola TaxID=9 RepID=UPI0034646D92
MKNLKPVKQALISVSNKFGIIELAKSFVDRKINILSTGGTSVFLKKNNIPFKNISDYTEFPELMDGRIKTIHPKIHGGILGRRKKDDAVMKLYNIIPIDIVVVNLYPFLENMSKNINNMDDIINYIDIGGSTLIRSAAKNHQDVMVLTDPLDYKKAIKILDENNNNFPIKNKFYMACKAFEYISQYDSIIFGCLKTKYNEYYNEKNNFIYLPKIINLNLIKKQNLRYGENHHQKAALYFDNTQKPTDIVAAKQIQGKLLSYNNLSDADIAWECVKTFLKPACVIVKHGTPCGVSENISIINAYISAYKCDPTSAFGGVIAFNGLLNSDTVQTIINQQFVEVIIATNISKNALKILETKKNIRVLICSNIQKQKNKFSFKQINGGVLVQDIDSENINEKTWTIVSNCKPNHEEYEDAIFAWKVVKFVKSNAVVYVKNKKTISIGSGQTSRIYSTKIANLKLIDQKIKIKNIIMASDAFIPFRDNVDIAKKNGVNCIIQSGGSIRDKEVIQAVNEYNMIMIFTNIRHFKH